jgi:uncharacterized protein YjbI with pentapeptide repeats
MILKDQHDLSGADLSGQDLSGKRLRKARLWMTNLSCANLDGADLTEAELIGVNLAGASLVGTRLVRSSIENVEMTEANLTRANLTAVKFRSSILEGSNLSFANATMSTFSSVRLRYSSLAFGNFSKSKFRNCRISHSSFIGAVLKDSSFSGCSLERAELRNCDFSKTRMVDCKVHHVSFRNSILTTAHLGSDLVEIDLTGTNIDWARFPKEFQASKLWKPVDESEKFQMEQSRLRGAGSCVDCKEIWATFSNSFCPIHKPETWAMGVMIRMADNLRESYLKQYQSQLQKCSSCLRMTLLLKDSQQCARCVQGQANKDYETRRRNVNRGRGDPYRWWRQS